MVALEVDGRPWRVVPDEVVARAGLAAGRELDRPLLRLLRAELRRAGALRAAGRTLARRDVSREGLRLRLERSGVAPAVAADAVGDLAAAGAVDDERFARSRAEWLAGRGWGDAAIEARLEQEGLSTSHIGPALAGIPPERDRIAAVLSRTDPRKAPSFLARRGFDPELVEEAVARLDAEGSARLR